MVKPVYEVNGQEYPRSQQLWVMQLSDFGILGSDKGYNLQIQYPANVMTQVHSPNVTAVLGMEQTLFFRVSILKNATVDPTYYVVEIDGLEASLLWTPVKRGFSTCFFMTEIAAGQVLFHHSSDRR